ncbi:MAG: hypothetical protein ACLFWL_02455 [Candidatus Brocadiia bacterium]
MTKDGKELVLSSTTSGVQVTRRIRVKVKEAGVRYVEIIKNTGNATRSVSLRIHTQLGGTPQMVLSTEGRKNATNLKKKEYGFLAWQSSSHRPSCLFVLSGSRSRIKPAINISHKRTFEFTYSLKIKPGKTVSVTHSMAQRKIGNPPKAKDIEKLFKPFLSRDWLRDLPTEVRHSIVNAGFSHYLGGAGEDFQTRLERLNVERGQCCILAMGSRTRLKGDVSGRGLVIDTAYGSQAFKMDEIAAIRGSGAGPGDGAIFLRNGQILHGKLQWEELRFNTSAGPGILLKPETLDRLVMQKEVEDGQPRPEVTLFVETLRGDRIAITEQTEEHLELTTPWKMRKIPLDEVRWLKELNTETPGYRIALRDGSCFFSFLAGTPLKLYSQDFGLQTFQPHQIRGLTAALGRKDKDRTDITDRTQPTILLTGENVLSGRIDKDVVHFVSKGGVLPVAASQIRIMEAFSEESIPRIGSSFEAQLWDGGLVSGGLKETTLPIRSGNWVAHVPAQEVLEIRNPFPRVPDTMRNKIATLIRKLGHASWEEREKAVEKIQDIGIQAKPQLKEAADNAKDPEIRRRAQKLLEDIQE